MEFLKVHSIPLFNINAVVVASQKFHLESLNILFVMFSSQTNFFLLLFLLLRHRALIYSRSRTT